MQEKTEGCIFPILNTATGKRDSLCGATTLFGQNGEKFTFCSTHAKIVNNYIRTKRKELKRGDRKPDGRVKIKAPQ